VIDRERTYGGRSRVISVVFRGVGFRRIHGIPASFAFSSSLFHLRNYTSSRRSSTELHLYPGGELLTLGMGWGSIRDL
jgi:hypothetical protein